VITVLSGTPKKEATVSRQRGPRQDAPPTKARTADLDVVYELTCHLQRSTRYHKARERFFVSWSNCFSFLSLAAGSSVVVSLLAKFPEWVPLAAGAAVAIMQATEQVFRLAGKARDHSAFASEFLALERILATQEQPTTHDILEIKGEVLSIEAREPPIKRYLDLICHNQVACAVGSDDLEELTFWQRTFAQYWSGENALQKRQKDAQPS
jgi:hypothetical protein